MTCLYTCTGIITNVRTFDRETVPKYQLHVIASDGGGLTCGADVVVSVTDVNDNAPVFQGRLLLDEPIRVREDAPVNTTLTRVTATDQDIGRKSLSLPCL